MNRSAYGTADLNPGDLDGFHDIQDELPLAEPGDAAGDQFFRVAARGLPIKDDISPAFA